MTFYSGAYLSIFSVVIFDQRRLLVIMSLIQKFYLEHFGIDLEMMVEIKVLPKSI